VHAAPDDRHVGTLRAHLGGELERIADLRAAHARHADEDRVAEVDRAVVLQPRVDDAHAVAGLLERAGDVEQLQRHLRVRRLEFAGEDEQNVLLWGSEIRNGDLISFCLARGDRPRQAGLWVRASVLY
jgi:hypothetical protein